MNSQQLRQEIEMKRPRYLIKYFDLMNIISEKGTSKGGDFIQFGPFYQTYMYAFMIGYHIGECKPIIGQGESKDFAQFGDWKPKEITDFILMLLFNESEKINLKWVDLDDKTDEEIKEIVSKLIRRIEGYANTGLEFLQDQFDNNKNEFRDPFVFVNLLRNKTKR